MPMRGGAFDPAEVEAYIASLVPEPDAWDDLRFPAQGINLPGGAADPTRDTTTGLLSFAGNQDNVIAGVAQMPHKWKSGTDVYPHLHLRFPTSAAANTRWKFEYDVASITGNFANDSGTYTTLSVIQAANPQNVRYHALHVFGALPMEGHTSSAMILWRVSRLANTDAADNDTNSCLLMEFDFHYRVGSFGTRTQASE
jgi:hypothetical protein